MYWKRINKFSPHLALHKMTAILQITFPNIYFIFIYLFIYLFYLFIYYLFIYLF